MKRYILLLSVFMFLPLLLSGCREADEEMAYDFRWATIAEETSADWRASVICSASDGFYIVSSEYEEENCLKIEKLAFDENVPQLIWKEETEAGILAGAGVDSQGMIRVFQVRGTELTCFRIDTVDRVVQSIDLTSVYESWREYSIRELNNAQMPTFLADASGYVYVCGDGAENGKKGVALWISDAEGNGEIRRLFWEGEKLQAVEGCENGVAIVSSLESAGGRQTIVRMVEADGQEQSWQKSGTELSLEGMVLLGCGSGKMLMKDAQALYRWDWSEGAAEQLLRWDEIDFIGDVLALREAENKDILGLGWSGGKAGKFHVTEISASQQEKRTQLILAGIHDGGDLSSLIAGYNMRQSEYKIVFRDYSEGGSLSAEDALERLQVDLVTGKQIDILYLDGVDTVPLSGGGYLSDLYEFMNAGSPLQTTDFVSAVMEKVEKDGRLYSLFPCFQLYGLAGSRQLAQQMEGWNLTEFQNWSELQADGVSLFWQVERQELLEKLFLVNREKYLNVDLGVCYFEQEDFIRLLRFVKELPILYEKDSDRDIWDYVEEEKVLLTETVLGNFLDMEGYRQMYGGEEYFIGYPAQEGSSTILAPCGWQLGICAQSEYADAAWDFICVCLEEYGKAALGVYPILAEAMDEKIEDELAPYEGDGEEMPKITREFLNHRISLYHASPEDVDIFYRLLDQAVLREPVDVRVWNIIEEEVWPYLEGQKTVEETVQILQNRVQLLLEENR